MTVPKSARRSLLHRATARIRARPRLMVSAILFFMLFAATRILGLRMTLGILLSFDISVSIFLLATAWMFSHSDEKSMRRRAAAEDNGGWSFLLSSIAVSAVVLLALGAELHAARSGGLVEIWLAATSLVLSWLFMNTMFALHYAHRYYWAGQGGAEKLESPGGPPPDYWDFAYFSFVFGMTFQVSDVSISDRHIRRIALMHGIIAFFFDVVIVALSVNLIAGTT
ncbi:MAG TPA: DUF1345 domain-containing protein [Dokdonella sp.]|nr:DUF1345 domain-containing protein [Dokdonella sp.]